jgi:hypothetical protein
MTLKEESLLAAYAAAESLPDGTDIYLDPDGDIAYNSDPDVTPTSDYQYLCTAQPGTFPMRNATFMQDDEGQWCVSGYSNRFETRSDAMEFALNHVGLYQDDFNAFIDQVVHNVQHSAFEA